jgi:WD40 repeat protein
MSMKLVWTLTAARRRITDQFRVTIKFAAWGNRAANSSRDVHAVSRHPDHLQLDCMTGSLEIDETPRLWDAATGEVIRAFTGHEGPVTPVAFSPMARAC